MGTSTSEPSIGELAKEWLKLDKNETTKAEIQKLLDDEDSEELEKRLRTRESFNRAIMQSLRAAMEAGFSRLNSLTIIQASQGLASYILSANQLLEPKERGVVIGHDHRHNSEEFARLTTAVFVEKGFKVYYLDELVHTPLVPFSVKHFKAMAGVMITASHNPAKDNGYKVYWSNACQIIPPHDTKIADCILRELVPSAAAWNTSIVDSSKLVVRPVQEVRDAYFKAVDGLIPTVEKKGRIKFVYTPMHGVGLSAAQRVVKQLSMSEDMVVVDEQARPDPDFPTVKFPNPEEKGALDLAMCEADKQDIRFVVANDPDADRFAAAEKQGDTWRVLTGNQLGVLFASFMLSQYAGSRKALAMLCSTVSTQMLSEMAKREGFHFEETLTGFKWLGNIALLLTSGTHYTATYAFEEAIGYMFSSVVPDKDGISALAVFLTFLHSLEQEGLTPLTKLEQMYQKYGYFESCNSYLISPDSMTTTKVFEQVRFSGFGAPFPESVGRRRITYWRDLTRGFDSKAPEGIPKLPVDPTSQMITCELDGGDVRFTVRASGTEPKVKLYIECKAATKELAAKGAQEVSDALLRDWFPLSSGVHNEIQYEVAAEETKQQTMSWLNQNAMSLSPPIPFFFSHELKQQPRECCK